MPDVPSKKSTVSPSRKSTPGRSPKTTVRRSGSAGRHATTVRRGSLTSQTTSRRTVTSAKPRKKGVMSGGLIWLILGGLCAAGIIAYLHHESQKSGGTTVEGPRTYPDKYSSHKSNSTSKHSNASPPPPNGYFAPVEDKPLTDADKDAMKVLDRAKTLFSEGSTLSGSRRNNKFKEVLEICRKVLHDPKVGDQVKVSAQKLMASANKHMTN